MRTRSRLAVVAAAFAVGTAPVAASAAWLSPGSGSGSATATSVNRANVPTATRGNGTVALGWTASTLASGAPVGRYDVLRHDGTSTSVVCSGVTGTSCTDTSPVPGPVSYGVVARIGAGWQGAESPLTGFQYDVFGPTTTITRNPVGTDATWNKSTVSVTLTAVDPAPVASGVQEIHYTVNGVESVAPGSSVTFDVTQEQVNQVSFWAVDRLGNQEAAHSTAQVRIDRTAPTTTSTLSPTPNVAGWTTTTTTVTLAGTDTASGVSFTEYSLAGAGGPWTAYTVPVPVTAEGSTTVWYRSTDVAGNVEAAKTVVVRLDRTAPVSTGTLSGSSLTIGASDATSLVTRIEYRIGTTGSYTTYNGPVTLTPGQTAYFHAIDNAGNVESPDKSVTYTNADTTPPTLAFVDPVEGSTYANNSGAANPWSAVCGSGRVCATGSDASGIASVTYTLEATSGTNSGRCWSGSGFVAKPTAGCAYLPMTAANNRYEGDVVPNGSMKTGDYTVTVKAQDASPAQNQRTITLHFKIS